MFFDYVQQKWEQGKVSVGLAADPSNQTVYIEASGVARLAVFFLNGTEKAKLAQLSKLNAANTRTKIA